MATKKAATTKAKTTKAKPKAKPKAEVKASAKSEADIPSAKQPLPEKAGVKKLDPEAQLFMRDLMGISGQDDDQIMTMMLWYMRRKSLAIGPMGVWAMLKQATPGWEV